MADIPAYKPDKAPAGKTTAGASKATPGNKGRTTGKLNADRPFKATIPELREALEAAVGYLVLGFSARGDMYCAEVVMDGGPDLIDSWIWMAEKHKEVRRALEVLCGGGGYLALLTSTLGVALPIMQHHGMYPEGAPTPRSLKNVMSNMFQSDADQNPDTPPE
jgi:hypothetical protein